MKKILVCTWIVLFGLFLLACGSEPSEDMQNTANTPTASPISPTKTPTPRPTAKMPPESTIVHLEPVYRSIGTEKLINFQSSGNVYDIAFDQEGFMWVATGGGVIRWDLSNNSSEKFTVADGLDDNFTMSIAVAADGSIWAESTSGISFYEDNRWNIEDEDRGSIIGVDAEENMWVTDGDTISYYDGFQWTEVEFDVRGTPSSFYDAKVGPDGFMWNANYEGLWSFDGVSWSLYDDEDDITGNDVQVIKILPDGGVWVASDEGLFHFDGLKWEKHPLPKNNEGGLYLDFLVMESGGLLASYQSYTYPDESGTYIYDGESWETFSLPDSNLSVNVFHISPDGAILIGTDRGVFKLVDETWQRFVIDGEIIGTMITGITRDMDGTLWFATENGISNYDGSNWSNFRPDSWKYFYSSSYIDTITTAPSGDIMSVGSQGIYVFKNGQWELYVEGPAMAVDWFETGRPMDVFEFFMILDFTVTDTGEIWVSGVTPGEPYPFGLLRYDDGKWYQYTTGEYGLPVLKEEYITSGAIVGDYITAIEQGPNGAMWFGTDKGLMRFDGKEWLHLSGAEYFPGNYIDDIGKGPDGSLWFATGQGFSHFDGYDWIVYDLGADPEGWTTGSITIDPEGVVWYYSDEIGLASFKDGILSILTRDGELLLDDWIEWFLNMIAGEDGSLWFGTFGNGAYRFQAPDASVSNQPLITPVPTETPISELDLLSTLMPQAAEATQMAQNADQANPSIDWNPMQELARFGQGSINEIEVSPDGEMLAIAGSLGVWLYDLSSYEAIAFFESIDHSDAFSVSWSPDSRNIVASFDNGQILVWNAKTGEIEQDLLGHTDTVWEVAWSPDGEMIASCSSDATIHVWDPKTGSMIRSMAPESIFGSIYFLSWSPDSKFLATNNPEIDSNILIWNMQTGELEKELVSETTQVWEISWSPAGNALVSGSWGSELQLWDVISGEPTQILEGHSMMTSDFDWSPDGALLAFSSDDGSVRIWDPTNGEVQNVYLDPDDQGINSISWSPDGNTIMIGRSVGSVCVWNISTSEISDCFGNHVERLNSVSWSPDWGQVAAGGSDGIVRIWDVNGGTVINILSGGHQSVRSVAWSPDGSAIASGDWDGLINIWDSSSGNIRVRIDAHSGAIRSLDWSPDNKYLVSGSRDGSVLIWDSTHGGQVYQVEDGLDAVNVASWSPDGNLIAYAGRGNKYQIYIWELATQEVVQTLVGSSKEIESLAWSPDGKWLAAAGGDNVVHLWNVTSGEENVAFVGSSTGKYGIATIYRLSWSPDGNLIAFSNADGTVRIGEISTGAILDVLSGQNDWIWGVTWSPDGSLIGTGGLDGTVRIWGIPSE